MSKNSENLPFGADVIDFFMKAASTYFGHGGVNEYSLALEAKKVEIAERSEQENVEVSAIQVVNNDAPQND